MEELTKAFGGIRAVDKIDYEARGDEIDGIIGPNGAGKTTFFNLITGTLAPDEGKIVWDEKDITDYTEHERSELGISRTFQITNLFNNMSVYENILLGVIRTFNEHWNFKTDKGKIQGLRPKVEDHFEILGLEKQKINMKLNNLSYPDQRMMELALAFSRDPDLLLLDEPFAGLTGETIGKMKEIIRDSAKEMKIILIDHKLPEVVDLTDRVTVMNQGKILTQGKPEEVQGDEKVQEVYIGGG